MNRVSSDVEVIIVGAGIVGAALAAYLSSHRRVALIEQESQPGYHSTGRSAAIFSAVYGNQNIRALSRATWSFLSEPTTGFSDHGLLKDRGVLMVGRQDQLPALRAFGRQDAFAKYTRFLSQKEILRLIPILRPENARAGVFEPAAPEIDVHGLQAGYIKMAKAGGAMLVTDARVVGIQQAGAGWEVTTRDRVFRAAVLVNAAGAWGDELAAMAGVRPLGLVPRRRTAVTVSAPPDAEIDAWPMVVDIGQSFYFKPDAGRILISPADEEPSVPCDAQPEELDVAIAIDRMETATTLQIKGIHTKWAGFRTFTPDESPAIGFDLDHPTFFWNVGLGGYGIQTCNAVAQLATSLLTNSTQPISLIENGVDAGALSPVRFSHVTSQ